MAVAGLSACSTAATKAPAASTSRRAMQSLAAADGLVRAGCFDCLLEAYRTYDRLRSAPGAAERAAAGAARSAMLLAIRERELGTEDSGYMTRARDLAESTPAAGRAIGPLLDIADALPSRAGDAGRQIADDRGLTRVQQAYRHREAWLTQLRAHADDDAADAYVWLAFNCAYNTSTPDAVDEWLAVAPGWRGAPLLAFRRATCGGIDGAALERLLAEEPRFIEVNYYLGLRAVRAGRFDDADTLLERAYAWRPRWPGVTNALGSVALTAEDFERAATFFERTLEVVPQQPDALLGEVRAFTYLGRHDEALAAVDRLLALGHWYVGDARYWRALNEAQLGRNEDAWTDVEAAAKLLVNAEVPKLAGIVSYRLHHLAVAQAKFEESSNRNASDCETRFYLGIVLSDERLWPRSAEVLVGTAACLQAARTRLTEEIASIEASNDPPDRKTRQIAKRERQIADAGRMLATSWFNTAVAYYNLDRKPEARQFAEKVAADDEFADRARDLLARLGK